MFPFDIDEEVEEVLEEEESVYKEYGVDFTTGQLTGKVVEGLEAVKVWVYFALHTDKYKYVQYSWDYGHELETLIGKGYTKEYLELEIAQMIEDCLLVNEHIQEVELLDFQLDGEKVKATIHIKTEYGEEEMDVVF